MCNDGGFSKSLQMLDFRGTAPYACTNYCVTALFLAGEGRGHRRPPFVTQGFCGTGERMTNGMSRGLLPPMCYVPGVSQEPLHPLALCCWYGLLKNSFHSQGIRKYSKATWMADFSVNQSRLPSKDQQSVLTQVQGPGRHSDTSFKINSFI